MTNSLAFQKSEALSLGIELELQLVNLHHFNLAMEAKDFLRRLKKVSHPGAVKPEITQSMVELNSTVHESYQTLLNEVEILKNCMIKVADQTHIGICGGGTHPFQKWQEQRIFQTERFASISEQYGYWAKQFTVFGQHIHIGCASADDAIYLCHAMAIYIPQFIALSAASPFNQQVDTAFDCSRLGVISAFPLSGTIPWMLHWNEFEAYFNQMVSLGIVKEIKDFYWDIRPKSEFGTVELRICDTPLTIKKAVDLAAYAQAIAAFLLETRPTISPDIYLTYAINRFRAARYGLEAILIDPILKQNIPITEQIQTTCYTLEKYSLKLNSIDAVERIYQMSLYGKNDASWLREKYHCSQSLPDVVRSQTEIWRK